MYQGMSKMYATITRKIKKKAMWTVYQLWFTTQAELSCSMYIKVTQI